MGEGLFCNIEACFAYVYVGGIEVMFDHGPDVRLNEEGILTDFFELVSLVFDVNAILVLRVNLGRGVWFFPEDVADVCIVQFIFLTDSMSFDVASGGLGV